RGPWAAFTRAWERGFHRLAGFYRKVLGSVLKVRWIPVIVGVGMFALVLSFIPLHVVGTEFVPQEDDNQFNINIQMPVGTALAATDAATKLVEAQLQQMPEVASVYTSVGAGANEQQSSIAVGLVDKGSRKRTVFDMVAEVRRIGSNIPGMQLRTSVPSPLVGGGGSPLTVVIRGQDFNTLQALTTQVLGIVQNTPG